MKYERICRKAMLKVLILCCQELKGSDSPAIILMLYFSQSYILTPNLAAEWRKSSADYLFYNGEVWS